MARDPLDVIQHILDDAEDGKLGRIETVLFGRSEKKPNYQSRLIGKKAQLYERDGKGNRSALVRGTVRVMAVVEGYAVVRRPRAIPFCVQLRMLESIP